MLFIWTIIMDAIKKRSTPPPSLMRYFVNDKPAVKLVASFMQCLRDVCWSPGPVAVAAAVFAVLLWR